ncbi:MAG: hypothetical protein JEY96_00315 [Bacteroidales bacterium]|nr:hypothetical protein [Bacteroidales bacterium]
MNKKTLLTIAFALIVNAINAQYIYTKAEYSSSLKSVALSNFDIQDTILYLPLGEAGLHILDISDQENIQDVFTYTEFERRSREKVFGTAHCVQVIENKAYLSFGVLGLKVLDVTDPTMPYVIGTYYRYQDVYCSEIYENYAFLGYVGMGLEIVDLSNLDNINMVARKNVKGFSVKNIQIIPPYVVISGGVRGLKIFKFNEPFTDFKQADFPRDYQTNNDANKILLRGANAYLANDFRGLTVLNMGLPLYPLEVFNVKTEGKATDLIIDGNYLYVACGKSIEVYDIKEPASPAKIHEYINKDRKFESLKMYNNQLYASFSNGKKNYGIMIFQVE